MGRWIFGALFAVTLVGCSASSDSPASQGSIVGDWARDGDGGHSQVPLSVSYAADHTFTRKIEQNLIGAPGSPASTWVTADQHGQWSTSGDLLTMTLDCSPPAACPSGLKVNYAVSGDTLDWIFAGGGTRWSFHRAP